MRRLLGAAISLAMFGTVFLAGTPTAHGCSCIESQITDAVTPETVAAFVGTPVSSRDIGYPSGPGWQEPVRWTFQVEVVLKGEVPEVVEVGSGYGGGDCGVDFTNRGRIGVVAYEDDLGLATGICGGVWSADELMAAHGPGYAPLPVEERDTNVALWGLLIGALIVGGSLFYATRPHRPSPPDA